jgi:hypothetical protein
MSQSTNLARSAADAPSWNEEVLSELSSLPYVRAVVFTDGRGGTLRVNRRRETVKGLAKLADLANAALTQAGASLELGSLEVGACVYEEGSLVLAGCGGVRVAVIADAGANLGALLNHVRRILRKEET